jgi:hypothetical protein
MRGRGFTNRELDIMFKDNPARLLGCRSINPQSRAPQNPPGS